MRWWTYKPLPPWRQWDVDFKQIVNKCPVLRVPKFQVQIRHLLNSVLRHLTCSQKEENIIQNLWYFRSSTTPSLLECCAVYSPLEIYRNSVIQAMNSSPWWWRQEIPLKLLWISTRWPRFVYRQSTNVTSETVLVVVSTPAPEVMVTPPWLGYQSLVYEKAFYDFNMILTVKQYEKHAVNNRRYCYWQLKSGGDCHVL